MESVSDVTVAGIVGSLRTDSTTRRTVEIALEGAAIAGATTRCLDLREYDLTFVTGDDDEDVEHPDVARLRADVKAADAVVLGTPEYHGSFSGVLKNALDLMGFDEFEGKMIGLVGTAGGSLGAVNALNGLRGVGRSLHAWVLPQQASVPRAGQAFDADGTLKDARLAERLREVGREVARFAFLHKGAHAQEFLREWEKAPENPGG